MNACHSATFCTPVFGLFYKNNISLKSKKVFFFNLYDSLSVYVQNNQGTGANMRTKPLKPKGNLGRQMRVTFNSIHIYISLLFWIWSYPLQYQNLF